MLLWIRAPGLTILLTVLTKFRGGESLSGSGRGNRAHFLESKYIDEIGAIN